MQRPSSRPHRPGKVKAGTVIMAMVASLCYLLLSAGTASAGTDDYPSQWAAPHAKDSLADTWNEFNRECTSFVAWRLHARNGFEMPFHDDASGWKDDALARGYTVNTTPAVGAVAWWSGGHVGWVEAVNGNGTINTEEYNWDTTAYPNGDGAYHERTNFTPTGIQFIHFADMPSALANGSFVANPSGHVYQIVGGAPLTVTAWAAVGGQQAVTQIAQSTIDNLPKYPANGTYISDYATSKVYEVVGGAPMQITAWSSVGGSHPVLAIDDWNMTNTLQAYPSDGMYVSDYATSNVYITVGGALMQITDWSHVGGSRPVAVLDDWAVTHQFRAYPANGSFIADYATSKVYQVIGSSPLLVTAWSAIGGQRPVTFVDDWAVLNRLKPYPDDGMYLADYATNNVYITAGGAPLQITSWAAVGGQRTVGFVDDWDITNQLRSYPADGTYVTGYMSQKSYITSQGTATQVTSPPASSVVVDDWAITNQLNVH